MEYLIDVRDIIVTKTKEMTRYLSFKSSFLRKITTGDSKEGRFFFFFLGEKEGKFLGLGKVCLVLADGIMFRFMGISFSSGLVSETKSKRLLGPD